MWRVPYICNAMMKVFHPKTFIDVGCGIADYVEGMQLLGVDAYGIEGSENCKPYLQVPSEYVYIRDLREPLCNVRNVKYDLVLCLEVAEHIEEDFVEVFLDNLCGLSDKVVMSFAPPGQEGHGHFNCQEAPYWIGKMAARGYIFDMETANEIKSFWEDVRNKREIRSYYDHLLYFKEC